MKEKEMFKGAAVVGLLLLIFQTDQMIAAEEDLCSAVSHHNLEEVKQLVMKGVKGNTKNFYGETPLIIAVDKGYSDIVEYLVEEIGVDVNLKDNAGNNALYIAIAWHRFEIANLLINNGADVNAKAENGLTPLHIAAWVGGVDIAESLIKKGADINELEDNSGDTPLHRAAMKDRSEMIKYLVERGANITIKNNKGKTAFDEAKTQKIKDYLNGCMVFKKNGKELVKYIENGLRKDEETKQQTNMDNMLEIIRVNSKYPGLFYKIAKDAFPLLWEDYFNYPTIKDFYLKLLPLYKNSPKETRIAFWKQVFELCKQPLTYNDSFEGKVYKTLTDNWKTVFSNEAERQEVKDVYKQLDLFKSSLLKAQQAVDPKKRVDQSFGDLTIKFKK